MRARKRTRWKLQKSNPLEIIIEHLHHRWARPSSCLSCLMQVVFFCVASHLHPRDPHSAFFCRFPTIIYHKGFNERLVQRNNPYYLPAKIMTRHKKKCKHKCKTRTRACQQRLPRQPWQLKGMRKLFVIQPCGITREIQKFKDDKKKTVEVETTFYPKDRQLY